MLSENFESEARFSVSALFHAVRKHWMLVCAFTAALGLFATFFTMGKPRIYEAHAVLMFDTTPAQPLGKDVQFAADIGAAQFWNTTEFYKTQFWIIRSERIVRAVVEELGLHKDAKFVPKGATGPAAVAQAVELLRSNLSVEAIKNSRLAAVTYKDSDPARAQRILAAVVDTYVQSNLDERSASTNVAADWLHSQLGTLKKDLESSELALHEYKKERNILSVSMDDQSNMLREEMAQLNASLIKVRTDQQRIVARRNELMKVSSEDPFDLPAAELLENPVLTSLREQYVEAVREVEALIQSGKGTNHPETLGALAKRDTTKTALLAEIRNIRGAIERDLTATEAEIGGLQRLYDDAQARALDLNLLEIEYNRLHRDKQNNEKLFSIVMERSKESDLTRMLRLNNVQIVERPKVPKVPVSPNVPLNIAGGIAFGLLLGVGLAVAREQLDRSIKSPNDIEGELKLSVLGVLPAVAEHPETGSSKPRRRREPTERDQAEAPGLIVHNQPSSGFAEAARAIRTNLLFMSPDKPYRTILITSAGPAEGKTTVACSIATAMAQAGRRVVLIDCDMRRPRLHRVFAAPRDEGITNALLTPMSVADLARPTQVPNLSLVGTGPLPPNPAELLHSETFRNLVRDLREHFDMVVIDSPPVIPVTDAAILSTFVDCTVLVVRSLHTSKDLARRAVRSVRAVNGNIVGCILNAVDLNRNVYGYRYHYYSYDGSNGYGSEPDDEPAREHARGDSPEKAVPLN